MSDVDMSGVKIYLTPSLIWYFFDHSHKRLQNEMVRIAENVDTKYAVYIDEDQDVLRIHVCKGDEPPEYTQVLVDEQQCREVASSLYRQYLFPITISQSQEDEDDAEETQQDMVDKQYEREDALRLAMAEFLSVALEAKLDFVLSDFGKETDDIVDTVLQYLSEEYNISVRRPMFILDEGTGDEEFCEYPYNGDPYMSGDHGSQAEEEI